jgi:hypothetical protein
MWEYKILVGKRRGEKVVRRRRRKWEDTIKMGLTVIGSQVVDCIRVAQVRYRWQAVMDTVMNHRVPRKLFLHNLGLGLLLAPQEGFC